MQFPQLSWARAVANFVRKTGDTMTGALYNTVGIGAGSNSTANVLGPNAIVARNSNGNTTGVFVIGDGATCNLTMRTNVGSAAGGVLQLLKGRGDFTTPVGVNAGDQLGTLNAVGYDNGGTPAARFGAQFVFTAISAFTPTNGETRFNLQLAAAGSITPTSVIQADHAFGFQLFGSNVVVDPNRVYRNRIFTVGTLPAGVAGMRTFVSDALAPAFGAAVAGGGAVTVPVYYTGAAWFVG